MPTHGVKTEDQLNDEYQAKYAELTGVESQIRKLEDHAGEIRTELQHLEIRRVRLQQLPIRG